MNHKLTARLLAGATISSIAIFTSNLGQPVQASEESDLSSLAANTSIVTEVKANGGEISQTVKSNSANVPPLTFTSSNPAAPSSNSNGKTAQSELTNRPQLIANSGKVGMASYYSQGDDGGTMTASGKRFNHNAMTAAHRTLPFGTRVRVTNLRNGRSVVVTINDRGPFTRGRIIDVSRGAARALGMINSGVARVKIDVLGR
jgi:rare lipoprotein A (peptidoglycan hydrolase)